MTKRMLGIVLLVTGFIFLVPNFGWFGIWKIDVSLWTFWPLYVILWGAAGVVGSAQQRRLGLFPLTAILVGLLFLLDRLQIASFSSWALPGVLILFGLMLLFGRRPKGHVSIIRSGPGDVNEGDWTFETNGAVAEIRGNMGDLTIGGRNWELKDSIIEQKVGSIRVDLTETAIPDGETVLEVECKMGDVDVVFPEDLAVKVEARCRVGSMRLFEQTNNGGGRLVHLSPGYEEAERKVRMIVEVKIGDLDVKRA